jgi:hypothetical protein
MKSITVVRPRFQGATLFVGSLIATAVSAGIVRWLPWVGWTLVILFSFCALVAIGRLADRKPILTIAEDGIGHRAWGVGPILWSEIEDAFVRTDGGEDFLCLTLYRPDDYLRKVSALRRKIHQGIRATGFGDLTVNASALSQDAGALLKVVREGLRAAKARREDKSAEPTSGRVSRSAGGSSAH